MTAIPAAGCQVAGTDFQIGCPLNPQVKPGMKDIAAFLESRRMAPYVGATSEVRRCQS